MNKINTLESRNSTPKTHDARELIGSESNPKVAKIILDKTTYLLKITKQNKLILTKWINQIKIQEQ